MNAIIEHIKNETYISDHELFLFGSRSKLGDFGSDTDFDFAVQDSQSFRTSAILAGYKEQPLEDAYRDCLSVSVYSKTVVYRGIQYKVQIITKKHLAFFKMLWNSISTEYYASNLWKQVPAPFEDVPLKKRFIRDTINQLVRTQAKTLLHCAGFYDTLILTEEFNMTKNELDALIHQGVEEWFEDEELIKTEALDDAQSIADRGVEYAQEVLSYLEKIVQDATQ